MRKLLIDNPLGMTAGRFVALPKRLPALWWPLSEAVLAEASITVRYADKVKLKVLLFKNKTQLQKFWREHLGINLGRYCGGCVSTLRDRKYFLNDDGTQREVEWRCDRRYYAIMGLCLNHLSYEVVTHESLHAAIAYVNRTAGKTRQWSGDGALVEEEIAYPLGLIADSVFNWLSENKVVMKASTRAYGCP